MIGWVAVWRNRRFQARQLAAARRGHAIWLAEQQASRAARRDTH